MKLLRVGEKNKEKPAILDKDGNLRDISKHINLSLIHISEPTRPY